MNVLPTSILYTQDEELARRIEACLQPVTTVRRIQTAPELESTVQQTDPAVVLFDLCGDGGQELFRRTMQGFPDTSIIAFGLPGSDTFLEAEDMGAFAVESPDIGRRPLQKVAARAHVHARTVAENRWLKDRLQIEAANALSGETVEPSGGPSLSPFSRVFRRFDDFQAACESMVEGIAECARAPRVGLFTLHSDEHCYRLQAGIKCQEGVRQLSVPVVAPLVRWMEMHTHLVTRELLAQRSDPTEHRLLKQTLDTLGAEILIPLHGRSNILGWVFIGHRATGTAFSTRELDDLMLLAESVTLTLENALLYREVRIQKSLAETVLDSIPIGIVAVDPDSIVRSVNRAAERMLEVSAASATNLPISLLDSRLADLLMRGLSRAETGTGTNGGTNGSGNGQIEWVNPLNHRVLAAVAKQLASNGECLGAVAIIHDLTRERLLRQKQDDVERASFWTELAAAISHEVRNPLVAINTFAQLLPERYADEEFRTDFRELATREIARLDGMVDQINSFANPPKLVFAELEVNNVLTQAIRLALKRVSAEGVDIQKTVKPGTAHIYGDQSALIDCFAHLIVNSIEALRNKSNPTVRITAMENSGEQSGKTVLLRVEDNGAGIPDKIKDKVFSPFCTTKARGIGLGLPIIRRTLTDHSGHLDIQTGGKGTAVTVVLPSHRSSNGSHDDETDIGSRRRIRAKGIA